MALSITPGLRYLEITACGNLCGAAVGPLRPPFPYPLG